MIVPVISFNAVRISLKIVLSLSHLTLVPVVAAQWSLDP